MDVQYYFKLSLHHLFIFIINASPTYLALASENGEISVTEMSIDILCALLHASVPFFLSSSKQHKLGGERKETNRKLLIPHRILSDIVI